MTDMPKTVDATLTLEDRVATLTFKRDDVRNALTGTALVADIIATAHWASRCEAVSVVILTGAGSAFSAGGNIKEMRDREGTFAGDVREVQRQYRMGIQQLPLALETTEVPLIAAVNGPAVGAGFDLACMCDLRIGCPDTLFGETFINLGLIAGDGGGWFLQRLVGYQRAAELSFTGRLVKAEEAKALGLLLEVVARQDLISRTRQIAQQIAAKPPQTLRFTKRLLKTAQRTELRDFLDLSACFQGICHHTVDHREALSAFLDKRSGVYQGR